MAGMLLLVTLLGCFAPGADRAAPTAPGAQTSERAQLDSGAQTAGGAARGSAAGAARAAVTTRTFAPQSTTWQWTTFHGVDEGAPLLPEALAGADGLDRFVRIAAGSGHRLALRSDGTVWAWGLNYAGQLGRPDLPQQATPVQVPGLRGVVDIAAGEFFSLALRADGTVWGWGSNSSGQLGMGATRKGPAPVHGLSEVDAIAAGGAHALARRADGTVWAWGRGFDGELGDDGFSARAVPVQVTGLANVTAIAAGPRHNLAVEADGTVWAWGNGLAGQLGDAAAELSGIPVRVQAPDSVVGVATGRYHSLALRADGTVWAWGDDARGQLGRVPRAEPALGGTAPSRPGAWYPPGEAGSWTPELRTPPEPLAGVLTPIQVPGLTDITTLAAGDYHSVALRRDGTVWAWGYNGLSPVFGPEDRLLIRWSPARVPGLEGVSDVAAGGNLSLALQMLPMPRLPQFTFQP